MTAEDATNNGIGNLTMEMLTRGTTTRSAEQIAEQLDAAGASIDAGCGNNSWFWTGSCLSGGFDAFAGLYADVVQHPAFADAELAEMKQRVDAGIAGEDANWDAQAIRFFKQSYFGPIGSPYQFMPVGTAATVDKLTADQLRQWYTQKVLGGRKVLAIYGDVDPDHAEAVVRKLMGDPRAADDPVTDHGCGADAVHPGDTAGPARRRFGREAVADGDRRKGPEDRAGAGGRGDRLQERQPYRRPRQLPVGRRADDGRRVGLPDRLPV